MGSWGIWKNKHNWAFKKLNKSTIPSLVIPKEVQYIWFLFLNKWFELLCRFVSEMWDYDIYMNTIPKKKNYSTIRVLRHTTHPSITKEGPYWDRSGLGWVWKTIRFSYGSMVGFRYPTERGRSFKPESLIQAKNDVVLSGMLTKQIFQAPRNVAKAIFQNHCFISQFNSFMYPRMKLHA